MTYISGKITGDSNYVNKFMEAENYIIQKLKLEPYDLRVVNPAKISDEVNKEFKGRVQYSDYMRADLTRLLRCDKIFMLRDWQDSKGAKLEHSIAEALGIEIIYEEITLNAF
jgi:hypothetical protein